jgi:hypothetical protein
MSRIYVSGIGWLGILHSRLERPERRSLSERRGSITTIGLTPIGLRMRYCGNDWLHLGEAPARLLGRFRSREGRTTW